MSELPMYNKQDQHQQQDKVIKEHLNKIKNKILVMSGKGGVGKSSIAACLAIFLADKGMKTGLMDVDLHGPSIPRMLGMKQGIQSLTEDGKAFPVRLNGNLQMLSIESLMGGYSDTATIWRGPLKIGVIRQFISDMEWGNLDYLVIDSPPGTGDEPLTIAQTIPDAKALIVTTPQEISLADVRKSINFCRHVKMEILGLIENMGDFKCPHCGKDIELFQHNGGKALASKENLTLLGSLPIAPEIVAAGDNGMLGDIKNNKTAFAEEFERIADRIIQKGA